MAELGDPPQRHWVLIVSLDARNASERIDSVLVVPFESAGIEGPTSLKLDPGETALPGVSYLKGHLLTTLKKSRLKDRHPRPLSSVRMKEVVAMIRRAFDPDAPWGSPAGSR
jgi:mRNA-degrading endonuclease toxin of MazEF toxin-antitoxin module